MALWIAELVPPYRERGVPGGVAAMAAKCVRGAANIPRVPAESGQRGNGCPGC